MPEISRFFGIAVKMYYNEHAPPHFHAEYGEDMVGGQRSQKAMNSVTPTLLCLVLATGCRTSPENTWASPQARRASMLAMIYGKDVADAYLFQGTVRRVQFLGEFAGEVVVTDFDPRFAVTIDVDPTSGEDDVVKPGAQVVFAVHSPTRVFAMASSSEECEGKTYMFAILRRGGNRRKYLRAVEKKD